MSETESIDGLQINQDMPHQRREWRAQRTGWVVIALLLVAALAGLLGPGPLSSSVAHAPDGGLRVEYDRFERLQSPNELRIVLPADLARTGSIRIRLNREFVESADLERFDPDPVSVAVDADGFVYEFAVNPAGRPPTVIAHYQYRSAGSTPVRVSVEGGPAVAFGQWVYP